MGEGTVATETEAIFYHVIVVISLSSVTLRRLTLFFLLSRRAVWCFAADFGVII